MVEDTKFAPPFRTSEEDILKENNLVNSQKFFSDIFGQLPGISAVINKNRQIIYANFDFLNLLGLQNLDPILGKRPGEAIGCVHSEEETGGCGTSSACAYCGAVNTILESQRKSEQTKHETRITSMIDGQLKSWDLLIKSTPVRISDQDFYILTFEDKSDEKRRDALERIFFHDIMNTAGGLNGLLQILKKGSDPEEARELINLSEEASRNLLEEILLHRQLRAAENGDLHITVAKMGALGTLRSAVEIIKFHDVTKTKTVTIDDNSTSSLIETDRILLQRILINMLKNSIEATEEGGTVNTGVESSGNDVIFWVKNDSVMPKEVQMQIFQRSFSTKGKGRGIGTYSIRLLAETYLNGKVSFTSNENEGTTFRLKLRKLPMDAEVQLL